MNYKIIVTGSRDWPDVDAVVAALENVFSRWTGDGLFYVIHGDCPTGADAMAQAWVDYKDEPDIIPARYPADWELYGRKAGPMRNKLMVDQGADEVLAFIRNNSPGASGCVRMARKAGIPVTIISINDKEKRVTETKTKTVEIKHDSIEEALVAFQAEMPTVGKDKINPHFKSRYADIASITEDIMPILAKHGLAFTCLPSPIDGGYEIHGVLLHATGRLSGSLPLFGNDAQKIGSSITYARRYLLCALTGVVMGDEDDDGNMATTTNERAATQQVNRAASKPRIPTDQIVQEMLAAETRTQVRALWEKYNVGGAPADVQARIQQHAMTLPEGDE